MSNPKDNWLNQQLKQAENDLNKHWDTMWDNYLDSFGKPMGDGLKSKIIATKEAKTTKNYLKMTDFD